MIRKLVDEKIRDMPEMANYSICSLAEAENRPDVKVMEFDNHISVWVKKGEGLLDVFDFVLMGSKLLENNYITGKYTLKRMMEFLMGGE